MEVKGHIGHNWHDISDTDPTINEEESILVSGKIILQK